MQIEVIQTGDERKGIKAYCVEVPMCTEPMKVCIHVYIEDGKAAALNGVITNLANMHRVELDLMLMLVVGKLWEAVKEKIMKYADIDGKLPADPVL